MRKQLIVALVFVFTSLTFAQVDIRRVGPGNVIVLDRGKSWAAFAGNGVDYVFDPSTVGANSCLFVINNNPTNSRTVSIAAVATADMFQTTYNGNTGRWVLVNVGLFYTIPASTAQQISLVTSGATHVAIGINNESGTAGGTPDTADLFVVNNSNCVGATTSAPTNTSPSTAVPPNQWTLVSNPAVGSQATVTKSAATNARHTAQCYSFCITQTGTTAGNSDIALSNSATCGTNNFWIGNLSVSATAGDNKCTTLCGLEFVGTAGAGMTACFGAALSGVSERVSLSGFDQ